MTKKTAKSVYSVSPESALELLSINEMRWLIEQSRGEMHELIRRCVLAVLNSGSALDNAKEILEKYHDFDVELSWQRRGFRFELFNPPTEAFVVGEMILGMREHLSAVVRDLVYSPSLFNTNNNGELKDGKKITDFIFRILRNAETVSPGRRPNLVVCWGGHSISEKEYKYTKKVGYEFGLRGLDICTGCGPGVMKGPMKGATISHAKHRNTQALYLGITEPGIIASEPPNPIVNHLVIMPDIEKRLESFVRLAHAIVIFPGGVGTAEELLYLLGILLHPDNQSIPLQVILSGPECSRGYIEQLDQFVKDTLGDEVAQYYQIIIDDPCEVAKVVKQSVNTLTEFRLEHSDSFHFNWRLKVSEEWQLPFEPTHESMSQLNLSRQQPAHELALNLRKAFSGIVAGNVKPDGVSLIEEFGPFILKGSEDISHSLNKLLTSFVADKRMTLPTREYVPCYRIEAI